MSPIVRVILPTRDRAETLPRAIRSVLGQTFEVLELIVVDDGSTDGSDRILASFASHDRVRILSNPRRGCAAARNVGVGAARGRYIAFQDSDDEWHPVMLERLFAALEPTGPEVGVCCSDMMRIFSDGVAEYHLAPDVRKGIIVNDRTLDYSVYGVGIQASVIKRECFLRAGPFDESMPRFIDLDFFIRVASCYEFIHVTEPLVRWYQTEGITSNALWLAIARQRLLEKYRPILRQRRHHLAYQYLMIATAIAECEEFRYNNQTLPFALKALMTAPFHGTCRRKALEFFHHGWSGVSLRAKRALGFAASERERVH